MNPLSRITLILAFLSFAAHIRGLDTQFATELQFRVAASPRGQLERFQLGEATLTPEIDIDFDKGWRLASILRLRHERSPALQPKEMILESYASHSRPWRLDEATELELRELLVEKRFGPHTLSLGKQQIVWGRADGLKVLDVVNPQSFRSFILEDFEDSRIPLWTANVEFALGGGGFLQLLWIPDTSAHALPSRNGRFAFTSPRVVPQPPPGIEAELRPPQLPNRFFEDSDVGARWSAFLGGWDLTLNYLYRHADLPVFTPLLRIDADTSRVSVTPQYDRSHLFGATFTNSFGDLTLRGEIGYETDKGFLRENAPIGQCVALRDVFSYVLGFDWFGLDQSLVSLQIFQSHVLDAERSLTRPTTDTTATLTLQRDLFNDTLEAEVLFLRNLNEDDGMIRSKIAYDWSDRVELWAALDWFHGDRAGLYGQFDDNDRFLLGARYTF